MTVVRAWDPGVDLVPMHRLWQRTVVPKWSMSLDRWTKRVASQSVCLLAEAHGRLIGFCAGNFRPGEAAGLSAIVVDPACQRQGVGSTLLRCLEEELRGRGALELKLGFGSTGDYFWPGVPAGVEAAWAFFVSRGWHEEEASFDLLQPVEDYHPSRSLDAGVRRAGYRLLRATAAMREEIERFEEMEFPAWAGSFRSKLAQGLERDVLLMQAADDAIVGTVLLEGPDAAVWKDCLGSRCASLSVLGVAEGHRRQGLGLALASYAFEVARDRGCSRCYINWTGLRAWYGRLGARVWAEYRMSGKLL